MYKGTKELQIGISTVMTSLAFLRFRNQKNYTNLSEELLSSSSLFYFLPIPFVGLEVELFTYRRGRIAIRPYACVIRTLANIHVKYTKKASWAWYEGVCVRCRGKGLQALSMVDMNFTTTPILCSSLKKHIEIFGK